MTNLALDCAQTQFENVKANLFSTYIFADEASDPNINFYNKKLQDLDLKYCSRNK